MCTQTRQCSSPRASQEIASSKSRAVTGSMVKVGSAVRSRRGTSGGRASWAARSTPGGNERRRPRSSMSASMTSRATSGRPSTRAILKRPPFGLGCSSARRPGRASRERSTVDAPAALEERLADEEATALLEQDDPRRGVGQDGHLAPATAIARSSPSSVRVLGSSLARTSGMIPLPLRDALAAEVAALGREVLPGGDVQRAAVGELEDLLEDALAEGLGAHDLRAVAVLQRAGDDLRGRGGAAVDEHGDGRLGHHRIAGGAQRLLLDRPPARGDDRPVLQEGRGDELRLGDQAAAVVAQVEHEDLGAALLELAQRGVDLGVRARAELRQAHDADLAAAARSAAARRRPARSPSSARRSSCTRRPSRIQVRRTSLPGGPLTRATEASCDIPARSCPSAATMTSPGRRPARLAGEPS